MTGDGPERPSTSGPTCCNAARQTGLSPHQAAIDAKSASMHPLEADKALHVKSQRI